MEAAAFAYQDGRYEEAEAWFLAAEQLAGEFEPSDPRLALTLGNLADFYHAQARDDEAEPLFRESLTRLERIDGPDSARVARFVADLAVFYTVLDRDEEAEPLYLRALETLEWEHGPYHDDVLVIRTTLAGFYLQQMRYADAEPLYREVLRDPARYTESGPGPVGDGPRRIRPRIASHRPRQRRDAARSARPRRAGEAINRGATMTRPIGLALALLLVVARLDAATVTTVIGTGEAGLSDTQVANPYGVVVGPDGALYFCDLDNQRIRRLDLETGGSTTIAGNGERGYSGDGGLATDAALNMPHEIQFDGDGHLYIVERDSPCRPAGRCHHRRHLDRGRHRRGRVRRRWRSRHPSPTQETAQYCIRIQRADC